MTTLTLKEADADFLTLNAVTVIAHAFFAVYVSYPVPFPSRNLPVISVTPLVSSLVVFTQQDEALQTIDFIFCATAKKDKPRGR